MIDSEVLIRAAKVIGTSLDPQLSVNGLLDILVQQAGLTHAWIVLPEDDGKLRIRYSRGLEEQEKERGIYRIGEGITGKVMSTKTIALIPDVSKEPAYLARAADLTEYNDETVAFIAVPILYENDAIGVCAVHRVTPTQASLRSDIVLLQVFAAFIQLVLRIEWLVKRETEKLTRENMKLKQTLQHHDVATPGIIGRNEKLRHSIRIADRAAASDAPVLLNGESGTGKERFARMIHFTSPRRDNPFIAINCASIPENLLETELFGHEKGAFTGAISRKMGKFEAANGGTLFLDEIGDMSFELQAKLLRTLQEGVIQRVGGNELIKTDVRIIAATHKDLQTAIANSEFRLDLFYRLNVIPIELPALRERTDDIPLLTQYFLSRANQRHRKNVMLENNAIRHLEEYSWPGNIRQLENVIERIVILSDHDVIGKGDIENTLRLENDFSKPAFNSTIYNINGRPYNKVKDVDREKISATLRECGGNKTAAALKLGMTLRQLHYRIQKLEISETNG